MIILKILGYIILAIIVIFILLGIVAFVYGIFGEKSKVDKVDNLLSKEIFKLGKSEQIQYEKKAEQLLGINLNLDAARKAKIEDDEAELARCINEQIGPSIQKKILNIKLAEEPKEALSKAIGMRPEELFILLTKNRKVEMKKAYLVELTKNFNVGYHENESKDIYEVSIKKGEIEYYNVDDDYGDFEMDDYISEQMFLSNEKNRFVYGKEIDVEEYKEIVKDWDLQCDFPVYETFTAKNEAIKYAKDLITQLKNGDFND